MGGRTVLGSIVAALLVAAPVQAAPEQRIVNGQPAEAGLLPWQAALVPVEDGQPVREPDGALVVFCGATIRGARHVITAAHCVPDVEARDLAVVTNLLDRSDTSTARVLAVTAITSHPGYRNAGFEQDLAVLTLGADVPRDSARQDLPVTAAGDERPGFRSVVSGWGTTSEGGDQPDRLRYGLVDLLPASACSRYGGDFVASVMLCAGRTRADGLVVDSCQGDSGGPLARASRDLNGDGLLQATEIDSLVGVVSFGEGCGRPGFPGVYTNLAAPDLRARATDPSPPARIAVTSGPAATGTAQAGQALRCTGDAYTPAPASRSVRWLSAALDAAGDLDQDSVRVDGEGDVLALTDDLVGRLVTCEVLAVGPGGAREQQAEPVGPVTARPAATTTTATTTTTVTTTTTSTVTTTATTSPATTGTTTTATTTAAPATATGGVPITPAPTSGSSATPRDLVAPVVRVTRRACARSRCTLTFLAGDSGGPAVAARLQVRRLGCPTGSRGRACRRVRTIAATAVAPGTFRVRTGRLAAARYRFTVVATDAGGLRSRATAVVLRVRAR